MAKLQWTFMVDQILFSREPMGGNERNTLQDKSLVKHAPHKELVCCSAASGSLFLPITSAG